MIHSVSKIIAAVKFVLVSDLFRDTIDASSPANTAALRTTRKTTLFKAAVKGVTVLKMGGG